MLQQTKGGVLHLKYCAIRADSLPQGIAEQGGTYVLPFLIYANTRLRCIIYVT